MTQTQKLAVIFTPVAIVIAGAIGWRTLISPSADVTNAEVTLTGIVRGTSTTNRSASAKYEFQTASKTYQIHSNNQQVANRVQEYALKYPLAVIKGRETRKGRTLIIQIRDLAVVPTELPLTLTGILKKTTLYPGRPFTFSANGKDYRTKALNATSINLTQAATTGQSISVTGKSYFYQFLTESYYEFDIYNAVASTAPATITAATSTPSPTVAPKLTNVSPSSAKVGTLITLQGNGFDKNNTNTISFGNGVVVNNDTTGTLNATTIRFAVPDIVCQPPVTSECKQIAITPGEYKISVTTASGQKSNEVTFTVIK